MKTTPIIEKVITEGAELYCERRGSGPLLLLITGGMGDVTYYQYFLVYHTIRSHSFLAS